MYKAQSSRLSNFLLLFATFTFLLFASCVDNRKPSPPRDTVIDDRDITLDAQGRVPDFDSGIPGDRRNVQTFPWRVWSSGRDLTGGPLDNLQLIEGDELWDRGRYADALLRYQEARKTATERGLLDASVARLASTQLALGNPEGALRTLSTYFQGTGRGEESVSAPFSLIFAYCYGSRGDLDQSLAWFSRTNRLHAGIGGFHEAADSGVRALLRVPATNEIHRTSPRWRNDLFINTLIGEELRRRSAPDFAEPAGTRFARFWEMEPGLQGTPGISVGDGTQAVVGVILPLSGKYSLLGSSVRQGMDLAFLGQQAGSEFLFEYRDSLGDSVRAISAYRELSNNPQGNIPVVVGPLLSGPAMDVAEVARRTGLPLVTLSKRSSLLTGSGVFRLGATLESQLSSLLDVAMNTKKFTKFAVVVSADRVGQYYADVFREFLGRRGVQVVFEGNYLNVPGQDNSKDQDLISLATEIEAMDVDAIFFPGPIKDASRFVGNLSRQKRREVSLIGLGVWDNPQALKNSRTILNRAMFVSPFFMKGDREVVKKFIQAYQRRYQRTPDFLAAQGFDIGTLVIAALRRARETGQSFQDALASVDAYDGLTGQIKVDPSGEINRVFQVVEITGGSLRAVPNSQPYAPPQPSYVGRGDRIVMRQVYGAEKPT